MNFETVSLYPPVPRRLALVNRTERPTEEHAGRVRTQAVGASRLGYQRKLANLFAEQDNNRTHQSRVPA
jgi:hypothetical protein